MFSALRWRPNGFVPDAESLQLIQKAWKFAMSSAGGKIAILHQILLAFFARSFADVANRLKTSQIQNVQDADRQKENRQRRILDIGFVDFLHNGAFFF